MDSVEFDGNQVGQREPATLGHQPQAQRLEAPTALGQRSPQQRHHRGSGAVAPRVPVRRVAGGPAGQVAGEPVAGVVAVARVLEAIRARPDGKQIEGHVDHRHLGLDIGRGFLPAEPPLQSKERQHAAVGVGQDLAVKNAVPIQRPSRFDDLRELLADVVQVAAVEPHLRPAAVELGADAVVLVLDPDRGAQARQHVGCVLSRRGEHELERVEEPEASFVQASLFGEDGGLARVAGQHHGHSHVRLGPLERFRDGRFQQPLPKADAQLTRQDLDHVLGRQSVAALQQLGEYGPFRGRSRRGLDGGEGLHHFGQARGEAGVRHVRAPGQHVGHGLPQVGRAVVGLAQRSRGHTRDTADRGGDGSPTQAHGPLIRLRERPSRQERGGGTQLGSRQGRQVPCEQRGLLRGASGPGDAFGQLAPATHGRDGIPSTRETRSARLTRSILANWSPRWPRRLIAIRGARRRSWAD